MSRVEQMLTAVRQWRRDFNDTLMETALSNSEDLIEFNKGQLYFKGIRADGTRLRRYKESTLTVFGKGRRPAPRDNRTENMTLKDYGDFYRGFKAERKSGGIKIDNKDSKRDVIVADMNDTGDGEKIFGVTDENLGVFINETLRPEMQFKFKQKIFG